MVQNKRLKVLIVIPNFYQAIGILGLNIVKACPSIDFYLFKSHDLLRRRNDFIKLTQQVDIVHWLSNISRLPLDFADLLDEIPCPTVGTVHHVSPGEEDKIKAASLCDVIHVVSAEWLEIIPALASKPVVLAHQPVEIAKYSRLNQDHKSHQPYRIGFFGFETAFHGRKRIDVLLESLKIIKAKDIPVEMVVQGQNWEKVIPFFKQAGIPIKQLGYATRGNAWQAYSKIDLYVCSSDIEGGPLTIIEALASHIPVVSTRVGVAPELLSNGGGFLVDKNDPIQLANAIECMLTNPNLYKEHKEKTKVAIQAFSQEKIAKEYQILYQTAIKTWEAKHKTQWNMIEGFYLKPSYQRQIELLFDSLLKSKIFIFQLSRFRNILRSIVSKLTYK